MPTIRLAAAAAALLVTGAAGAADRIFSAADVPTARLKKPGIVVSNDGHSITAWRFAGDIRESLVSIRSTPQVVASRPFGPVVFDASASAEVPRELSVAVHQAARTHGVDPRLIAAVARRESAWNVMAVSRAGALGIMQLMPATAEYLSVRNAFDPHENINGGTRYLRTLLDTFGGDLDLTLAAYNAGPGAVRKYRGVPPYRETRAYVAAVRAIYERALGR